MEIYERPILARLMDGTRMTPNGFFVGAISGSVLAILGLMVHRKRILERARDVEEASLHGGVLPPEIR
jgi:hypothetical protein